MFKQKIKTWYLFLMAGTILRFLHLGSRSLWLDEAWLANLIRQENLGMILSDPQATAPSLFLALSHFIVKHVGQSEFVLRLIPCFAGVASIYLIYLLARLFFNPKTAAIAVFLASFNLLFIYYSKELKQYSFEMATSLAMLVTAEKVLGSPNKKISWVLFFLVSVISIFLSNTFVFIYLPITLVMIFKFSREKLKSQFWAALALSGALLTLFLFYFQAYSASKVTADLTAQWDFYYTNITSLHGFFSWLLLTARDFFNLYSNFYYVEPPSARAILCGIFGVFFLTGIKNILREKKYRFAAYLAIPLVLILLASILQKYPFAPRLLLFLSPLAIVVVSEGISFLGQWLSSHGIRKRVVYPVFFALAAFYLFAPLHENLLRPVKREEMKPLITQMSQLYKTEDAVYVYYGAVPAFQFYWPYSEQTYTRGLAHRGDVSRYAADAEQFINKNRSKRIWFIFSHERWDMDEKSLILNQINKDRILDLKIEEVGVSAYLFKA